MVSLNTTISLAFTVLYWHSKDTSLYVDSIKLTKGSITF